MSTVKTILHPVTDLAAAKAVYDVLVGAPPTNDEEYYVGYETDGMHIGLVPGGAEQGLPGPVPQWHVEDLDATLAALVAAGATVVQEPKEVGWGRRVAQLTDADGNHLGLIADQRP